MTTLTESQKGWTTRTGLGHQADKNAGMVTLFRMAKRQQKQQVPPGRRPVGYTDLVRWVGLQVQGKSLRQIAKEVGRDKDTVNRTLKKPEAVELRRELVTAVREHVSDRLVSLSAKAVASWERQMDLANQGHRANHLVAKDLLIAARVVDIPIAKKAGPPDVVIEFRCVTREEITFAEAPDERADLGPPKTIPCR